MGAARSAVRRADGPSVRIWGVKRSVLCAFLIYVALDLSLPMMPGAFVFEPADSVESLQTARGRAAGDLIVAPVPARNVTVLLQLHVTFKDRLTSRSRAEHHGVAANRLPRSLGDSGPSRPSEDPH